MTWMISLVSDVDDDDVDDDDMDGNDVDFVGLLHV
jgi:hypothetical protein